MISTDVKKIERDVRRHFHDDIIVVVIFLGTNVVSSAKGPSLSMVVTVAEINGWEGAAAVIICFSSSRRAASSVALFA
ncbi:hypothetical protein YC2023_043561 [Brassica napus]